MNLTASPDLMRKALRYRWLIFSLLSASYILVYFHRTCPAVLAMEIMRDLKTGGTLTGLLGAAYFYPYALMQLPAGLLSDSWGPRKTITLFFFVAFIGSMVLGLSPSVSWAIVGRTLVGAGVAMLFVPTMKILAEWFHRNEFARMTGLLMAMGGVGSLSAAVPLVWLSTWIGWRNSFIAIGLFTLILALLVWIFVRNRPSDFHWPSPAETESSGKQAIGLLQGIGQVVACPPFWVLAVWFFFNCGIFFSFAGLWGGPFLQNLYGMDKVESGNILSMPAMGMVLGSPFLSFLSDRVFRARKTVLLISGGGLIFLTGMLAFYTDKIPVPGLYLIYFFMGLFASAVVVIAFTMNKELFPVRIAGTATGLINLFPFVGGAVFQPLLGHILEKHGRLDGAFTLAGYRSAFLLLFVSSLVAFGAAWLSKETLIVKKS
ncbi:MAG: MFS transporter [Thermodesulfobacteriota bacterium]